MNTGECAIIDPVLDTAERDHSVLQALNLKLTYTIDTHIHADHLSGAKRLKSLTGSKIVYPAIDEKYPATLSPKILRDILRDKLEFGGVVFTDAMEMHAIAKNYQNERPAVLAIKAGADVILFTSWGKETAKAKNQIREAYLKGEFKTNETDLLKKAVARQIKLKIIKGLIPNLEGLEYLTKLENKKQELYSSSKNQYPELNQTISNESIRSYKKDFSRLSKEKTAFILKNKSLKYLQNTSGIENSSLQDANVVVTDSFDEKDEKRIQQLAKNNSRKRIIILHYGNPFIHFPQENNIEILFSFSPTEKSLQALFYSVFGTSMQKTIPRAKLIFH